MKKLFLLSVLVCLTFSNHIFSQVSYTQNVSQGCPSLVVTFTNTTTNPNAYRYEWYFGDASPVLIDTTPVTVMHTYTASGNYYPSVAVYDNIGGWVGSYNGPPINVQGANNFYLMNDTVCPNDVINFNADPGTSWNWNFGDGNTSTQQYTQHSYTATGTYTVTLNMNDLCGNHVFTQTLTVINNLFPVAWINFNPNKACPGESINFSPSNSGYSGYFWNFGDGNTSTVTNVSHSYSATGTYTVMLVVTNGCGNKDTAYVTDTIANGLGFPFGVNAYSNVSSVCPTQQVGLYVTGDNYPKYIWNFGDGSPLDSSGNNVYHAYASVGTKTVTCTVTNFCGIDSVFTTTVNVASYVPFPNWFSMNVSTSPSCPNSYVNLSAPGSPQDNYFYVWNFGDGSPKDSAYNLGNINHLYVAVGTYTASVKIRNACGNDTTLYGNVAITNNAPFPNNPSFQLTSNPNPACPGDIVAFSGPGGFTSYQWNFGDGSSVLTNPYSGMQHIYTTLGTYTASVIITNNCGNDTTLYSVVNITNNAGFSNLFVNIYPTTPCPSEPVFFYASFGYASYVWNFGDGTIDTTLYENNSHSYSVAGTYSTSLTIQNNCGLDTTLSGTITISNSNPIPNNLTITVNATPSCPGATISFSAVSGMQKYVWNMGDGTIDSVSNANTKYYSYATVGTYTVSLILTNYCGLKDTLYTTVVISSSVGFPSNNFSLDINPNPACPGQYINLNAPYGYASYIWNYGDGSPVDTIPYSGVVHPFLSLGSYSVSVTIINFCGLDTTLYGTVNINSNVGFTEQLFFNPIPVPGCPGDQIGLQTNYGYASYVWIFGDGDTAIGTSYAIHSYSVVGTYTAYVNITNQCGIDTTLSSIVVIDSSGTFSNYLTLDATPTSSCPNEIIKFELNGNLYSSYFWNFGDGDTATTSGNEIQHSYSAVGVYNVSCMVTNGCGNTVTKYATVQISTNVPVSDVALFVISSPACPGDEITFLPIDGQSTYTYIWDFGDASNDTSIGDGTTHIYSAIGNYTVTLTAINNCGYSKVVTAIVSITNNAFPSLTLSNGDPLWGTPVDYNAAGCAGDAILFYFFGTAANNVWNFGDGYSASATQQMVIFSGNASVPVTFIKHAYAATGTYSVTLTLTNACGNSTTDTIYITIGNNVLVDGELDMSPPPYTSCGSIDFLSYGGSLYQWDFGDGNTLSTTSPDITHTYSTPGVYAVSVIVTNSCGNSATYSGSVNVISGSGATVNISSSSNPSCLGNDGSATVNVSSGVSPFTYLWDDSNAQTTVTATGLSAGTYIITVTDHNGCPNTATVTLSSSASIGLASTSTQATCGVSDGTASISVTSGGTPPYNYSWSSGATTSTATGLAWGPHTVIVTDAIGCTSSAVVSISENGAASLSVASITNATCYGGSNGSINMNVTGGNPPYTYAWSTGSTLQDPAGLAAGNYSVLVTDGSGCKATLNATVGQGNQIIVSTSAVVSPTCGNFDGSASASASAGNPPYSYLWINASNQTTQTATGLPAGNFSVTVTDANGCTNTGVIALSNSNAPSVSEVVTDVSCFGGSDGSIDLTITGGTSPYLYTWNVPPPQTNNQDLANLVPGTYIVSIQDASGCFSVRIYYVTQPAQLLASVTLTSGATCGNNDGTATATPSGGTSPYTYSWTGGSTSQSPTGLALGNYTVTVTDNNGCVATSTTTITATTNMQAICMVTVDSTSTKNIIVWEKPVVTNIDSFRIYRDIASVYTYIGSVPYSGLSTFTDNTNGVNPNITSYRYEITALDTCGLESSLSSFHKTIHLQLSAAIPTGVNLNWDDYLGFTVTQYRILLDSNSTGNWWAKDSVPFGITSYLDPNVYPDTASYMIEVDHPSGCVATLKIPQPMATNFNSSKSNIYKSSDSTVTSVISQNDNSAVIIYPNPNSGIFTIDAGRMVTDAMQITIYNVYGEKVHFASVIRHPSSVIDLSKQSKGIYYVQIVAADKIVTRKIIIE